MEKGPTRRVRALAGVLLAGMLAGGCVAAEAARETNERYENLPPQTWPSQRLIPAMNH